MKRTLLITGSTDGIGKLAAIKLAKEGHEVYIHGRNSAKLEKVIDEIKRLSKNENIGGFVADLSDLQAVREMAEEVNSKLPKLDVLINNAGVFKSPVSQSQEGWDIRFVVNFLAPYVLTHALMELLQKGADSRIINLSSAAQAPISLELFKGNIEAPAMEAYAQSKLAITMWSFYLAKQQTDISVIPVNPGSLLNTNMVREAFGRSRSSADKGADILYDLAVSDKHKGITGKYFDNDAGSYGQAHSDAYSEAEMDKLLQLTAELLEG